MSKSDLTRARERLTAGGYTCVLCKGEEMYTSTARGVSPLLAWVEEERDFSDFSAADKVVGRGAAFLYVILGVKAVYAEVMSRPAREVLRNYGIEASCDRLAEAIVNRAGDGFCPMETAVRDIAEPQAALLAIKKTAAALAGAATNKE